VDVRQQAVDNRQSFPFGDAVHLQHVFIRSGSVIGGEECVEMAAKPVAMFPVSLSVIARMTVHCFLEGITSRPVMFHIVIRIRQVCTLPEFLIVFGPSQFNRRLAHSVRGEMRHGKMAEVVNFFRQSQGRVLALLFPVEAV
jgi:hypothetical protein